MTSPEITDAAVEPAPSALVAEPAPVAWEVVDSQAGSKPFIVIGREAAAVMQENPARWAMRPLVYGDAAPARPDVTALREARDAINHALMALPFPSAASARRAWDGLIDVRDNLDAALAQSAAPDQPSRRDFWLHYDHQGAGRWCVENEPPRVIRPGAEVIHVREISPVQQAAPSGEGK